MTELVLDKSTTNARCKLVTKNGRFYDEKAGITNLVFRQGALKWL
jgi:hypothetical protein